MRKKLMLIMLLIAIVPLTIATAISYQNSKQAMEKEVLSQNSSKIEWVNNEIQDNLERIDEALTAFYYDNNMQFYLSKVGEEDTLKNFGSTYFRDKLRSYLFANYRDFVSVSFYVVEEKIAYHYSAENGSVTESLSDDFMNEKEELSTDNGLFIFKNTINEYSIDVESVDGPYLTKFYRRFDDQKIMSILVTKLNWDIFNKAIELLNIEKDSQIYFVNKSGKVIDGLYKEAPSQDHIHALLESIGNYQENSNFLLIDDYYVFFESMTEDIYIVKTIPKSIVSESYIKTLNLQMLIIIVTSALVIMLTIFLGMGFTKPITMLAKSMQDIEGHINGDSIYALPEVKTNDEIKILEQSYKLMLKKIKDLIDQEYKQKIEIQSAHLMALQAQINPHFMYNTLQMIGAMAVEKNSPEIYQIISAFSNMMRYNMRLSEEMVTIQEEVDNVKNYLQIQQMRFDNKLKIDYFIDEQIKDYKIPKLSMQPIVENCFKHAFSKKNREWYILVKVLSEGDTIVIDIQDNGKGVSSAKIQEIQRVLAMSTNTIFNHSENLGLKNIDSRIKLFFGEQYGLHIEGSNDKGTTVIMRIGKILPEGEV